MNENRKYGLVRVYNQELLKLLNQNHCIAELKDVIFDKEKNRYAYLFAETEEVAELIVRFEKENGSQEPTDRLYHVNNYKSVEEIIDAGFGNMLVGTYWDAKKKKRIYVFRYNKRIEEINEYVKEQARIGYANKHCTDSNTDKDEQEDVW